MKTGFFVDKILSFFENIVQVFFDIKKKKVILHRL